MTIVVSNNITNVQVSDSAAARADRLLAEAAAAQATGVVPTTTGLLRLSSIAYLRTTAPDTSKNVLVSGYYTDGDGGGGLFYAKTGAAAGTYVDNGGTIIVPNSGNGSSAWLRVYENSISVKAFGAKGDNSHNDTSAIQAALDAISGVYFPIGIYRINSPLSMNTNNFVFGEGRNSKIYSTYSGAIFRGKGVTPSSGTNVRVYSGGGRDLYIENLNGKTDSATIGLDMRGCTMFKWFNIQIYGVNTGVVQGYNYSSYYNEYHGVDMGSVSIGYYSTALGNENLVVGGRVNDCDYGTIDQDNSHNKYIGCAIEGFTNTAHVVSGPAAQYITFAFSRMENLTGTGTGISINSNGQETQIISPVSINLATNISDAGTHTNIFAQQNFQITGGASASQHITTKITKTLSSLAAGATRQEAFTVSGVAAGDTAIFTAGPNWPNVLAGPAIAASGTVYVQLYNPTGSTINFSSDSYRLDVWKYN